MSVESSPAMELSKKVRSLEPSATLAISAKAKELQQNGVDVVALSAGEPDFDTPDFIKEAAIQALKSGQTKYTPAAGTLAIRQAIARKLKRDQGLEFDPSQVIVSGGAKHSLFNVLYAVLNEDDEVLIPAPYWLSYPAMTVLAGGRPGFIMTDERTGFRLTPEMLRNAITPKTKVLILNSPSNPTGAVYTRQEMEGLAAVLKDFPRVMVLSDEIYEKLIFGAGQHYSIASLDHDIARRTVIVNGHSKAYAMTGWRLGYAACPNKELAQAISSMQSHSTSNPTSFAQAGGVVALDQGEEETRRMRALYEKRCGLLFDQVAALPKLKPFRPGGAFYLFVNTEATGLDSVTLAAKWLEEAHVAVVPGRPFGSDKHVRMSFATSEDRLLEACRRLEAWLK